jgi:hypothetical protein
MVDVAKTTPTFDDLPITPRGTATPVMPANDLESTI